MTARISADSDDRALIAGLRMLFGTAAAVAVMLFLDGDEIAQQAIGQAGLGVGHQVTPIGQTNGRL